MSYFKKFTDFCAGFAAFSALASLFFRYMEYVPLDKEGEPLAFGKKLTLFFDKQQVGEDHRIHLFLVLLLALSVLVSLLFKKLPAISFAISLLPLALIATMHADGTLSERPMLYLLLACLHTAGSLYEAIRQDRESGKTHQAHLAVNLGCGVGVLGMLWIWIAAERFTPLPSHRYTYFGQKLYEFFLQKEAPSILWQIALVLLLTLIVSLLLREIYFLDAALALISSAWCLSLLLNEKIPLAAEFVLTVTLVNAVARIVVMLSCPPTEKTDTDS